MFRSKINFNIDVFKVLLVSSKYIPDKNQTSRFEIQGEVQNGNGYIRGGQEVNVAIVKDTQRNQIDVSLGKATWNNATINANGAIYYRSTNQGPSNDDLICFIEFENEASSTNGTFIVTPSIIRLQL
jgi:hypothetical protein